MKAATKAVRVRSDLQSIRSRSNTVGRALTQAYCGDVGLVDVVLADFRSDYR